MTLEANTIKSEIKYKVERLGPKIPKGFVIYKSMVIYDPTNLTQKVIKNIRVPILVFVSFSNIFKVNFKILTQGRQITDKLYFEDTMTDFIRISERF